MSDRDDELRAALALLRSEPPENGFEQRLSTRLAYEVSLRPLRAEPPARDFEARLRERLLAEPEPGPALRVVGGLEHAAASAAGLEGLTPDSPDQGAVAPLPAATPGSPSVTAPAPAAAPRKRQRAAWLVAAIVLLAGGATASAQSGLLIELAARVEHVVSAWSRSSATAERERAAAPAPARPERLAPKPSEVAARPALAEASELARPEPLVVAPPTPATPPVERLELSAAQRARAGEAAARRDQIERVRRDVEAAARERSSREARTTLPRASALAASRREDGPRRAQIERVRIEPRAMPARRPAYERVRPSDVVQVTRERQSRERPELIMVRDGARRAPAPEPPRRERAPQDLTRRERLRR
jgi:hypothetical protein